MTQDDKELLENNATSKKIGAGQRLQKKITKSSHSHVPSDIVLRVKALEKVLAEKKLIDPTALEEVVDR